MVTRPRLAVAFAAAVASVVVAPIVVAPSASAACLAWLGARDTGTCISYSNGSPTVAGTPNVGIIGPNAGSATGPGLGVYTGPLLPGQTINIPISP